MQVIILLALLVLLVWIIFSFGIELALVVATLISAVVWGGYRLTRGKREHEPLLVDYAKSFLPIFLIVLLLRSFLIEPFRIPSGSMIPTLLIGDFILVNKFAYGIRLPVTKTKVIENEDPQRGDVIVFRYPEDPKTDFIKRVVAVPGDKVSYRRKQLVLNGEPVPIEISGPYSGNGTDSVRVAGTLVGTEQLTGEPHPVLINPRAPDFSPNCRFLGYEEVEVPAGHYFVMGDNRDDSRDSRCWGFVPDGNLVGKAFLIWMSFDPNRPGIVAWDRIGMGIN